MIWEIVAIGCTSRRCRYPKTACSDSDRHCCLITQAAMKAWSLDNICLLNCLLSSIRLLGFVPLLSVQNEKDNHDSNGVDDSPWIQ